MATLQTNWTLVSQTYVGNSGYGNVYIRTYGKYSSIDVANNKSYVYAQSRLYFEGLSFYATSGTSGSVSCTGLNTQSNTANRTFNSGETVLSTTEGWITHTSDGSKSVTIGGNFTSTPWGYNTSTSGTGVLPKINRTAEITSFTCEPVNQTTVRVSFTASSICDQCDFSYDGGLNYSGWYSMNASSGTYLFSYIFNQAGETIQCRIKLKAKSSQLTTESDIIEVTLPDYFVKIKNNEVWKDSVPYIKIDGVWKKAIPRIKVDGYWKWGT